MSVRSWFDRPRAREALGIAGLGATVLLLLALLSYTPTDPSLFVTGPGPVRNWIGPAGAHVAALLFETLGLSAWLTPLLLLAASLRAFRPGREPWRRSAVLGLSLVALATAVLLAVLADRIVWRGSPLDAGGLVGRLAAIGLVTVVSRVGALIVAVTMMLAGLALAARSSLAELAGGAVERLVARTPAVGRTIVAAARGAGAKLARWRSWFAGRLSRTAAAPDPAPRPTRDELVEATGRARERLEAAREEEADDAATSGPARRSRRRRTPARQARLPVELPAAGQARLPPTDLLEPAQDAAPVSRKELLAIARLIERRCAEFGVEGEVREFHPGPVVTTFEFRPNAGIKLSRITALTDDLALALEAENVRIDRLPGRSTVGIEVPNRRRELISLREVVESPVFRGGSDLLTLGLGKTQEGEIFCASLARMPHLLIAGATGSGKSVGLNAIIASILFRARPDEVKFILVDPKMLELGVYADLPHLLVPVVTDMKLAGNALKWAVREMDRRYRLLAACQVRHLDSYNRLLERDPKRVEKVVEELKLAHGDDRYEAKRVPYIVIVVDELADMLMTTGSDVVEAIARLAQKARAVGIHLVLATQRPSVDVLIGAIKANFPARIAFRVASKIDSRTILDASGAERLLGAGDMLFRHPSSARLTRVHGAWVSEAECLRVVAWLRQQAAAEYDESVLAEPPAEEGDGTGGTGGAEDSRYWEAVRLCIAAGQGSTSFLQRKMGLGYSRAARIVDQLEANGILGPADGSKPRPCLVGPDYLARVREYEEGAGQP
ncbi:MAG: DNA translocase FtsK [Acidobacteriota bacterium]